MGLFVRATSLRCHLAQMPAEIFFKSSSVFPFFLISWFLSLSKGACKGYKLFQACSHPAWCRTRLTTNSAGVAQTILPFCLFGGLS